MNSENANLNALAVRLYGRQIGIITRLAGERQLFAFERDYIDDPDRPTLSLSFKSTTGGVVTRTRPVSRRVPPFFANLLPEGPLRSYLAKKADVNSEREFFLLAVLGADLPGAVIVEPTDAKHHADESQEAETEDLVHAPKGALRFSLAGVQLKFSAVMEASGGLTIPAGGTGGSWIVKLPSAHYVGVPENEHAMLELARRVGIEVPKNELLAIDTVKGLPEEAGTVGKLALAVQRFDRRTDGSRVHMEDFAQVFGLYPNDKYEHKSYANIASVLWAETGQEATYEFVRRVVFSVLIGNADMHLKNWSLLYPDRRKPVLSPAYDFVSTIPCLPNDTLGLNFGGSRALGGITKDQIRRFADTARIPVSPLWEIVMETAERTVESWKTLEHRDAMPKEIRAAIEKQIFKVAEATK
ncbi:MAG TPA: HipA domain-containing protein [Candidatus Acidoferrum sp.]|nr:HipA domain-containing protein [Candidatus Acidoferrum sp.]